MKKVVFILMFLLFPSYIFASPKIEDYVTTSFEEALIEEGIEKNFDTWVTNEKKVPIYAFYNAVFLRHADYYCLLYQYIQNRTY